MLSAFAKESYKYYYYLYIDGDILILTGDENEGNGKKSSSLFYLFHQTISGNIFIFYGLYT